MTEPEQLIATAWGALHELAKHYRGEFICLDTKVDGQRYVYLYTHDEGKSLLAAGGVYTDIIGTRRRIALNLDARTTIYTFVGAEHAAR